MESSKYWERRALEREAYARKTADSTIKNKTVRYYAKAQKSIDKRIEKIFNTFARNSKLTKSQAKSLLSQVETKEELESLRKELASIKDPDIKRKALARLNAGAYRARISRLEALKVNIETEQALLADREKRAIKSLLSDTCRHSYLRHIYDTQIGTGLAFSFDSLSQRAVAAIINERFNGKTFSQRVWLNTNETAKRAYKILTNGIMTGESVANMSKELSEALNSGEYESMRLIRTEVNRVHNAADIKAYEEEQTDEYIFLATLDGRTCKMCGSMDGKTFKISEANTGVNFPPLHPNDRCTTIGKISENTLTKLKRRAKDPETGKETRIPANTTYSQWIETIEEQKDN